MIRYRKLRDLKTAMTNLVCDDMLVVTLFEDIPELQEFTFIRNQEYDDNNYYDNTRLTSVNGHSHPFEDDDYGDEVGTVEYAREPSNLPKIPENKIRWIADAVAFVAEKYDYCEDEHTFKREDFKRENYSAADGGTGKIKGLDKCKIAERTYFVAHLAGKKLPDSFFLKNDLKYALYYGLDHGRFKPETESKLFARRGELHRALDYARHVIKGRLPADVENFFILDANEDDADELKEYVGEFVNFASTA